MTLPPSPPISPGGLTLYVPVPRLVHISLPAKTTLQYQHFPIVGSPVPHRPQNTQYRVITCPNAIENINLPLAKSPVSEEKWKAVDESQWTEKRWVRNTTQWGAVQKVQGKWMPVEDVPVGMVWRPPGYGIEEELELEGLLTNSVPLVDETEPMDEEVPMGGEVRHPSGYGDRDEGEEMELDTHLETSVNDDQDKQLPVNRKPSTVPDLSKSEDDSAIVPKHPGGNRHSEPTDDGNDSLGSIAGPSLGHGNRKEGEEEMELEAQLKATMNDGESIALDLLKKPPQSVNSVLTTPSGSDAESTHLKTAMENVTGDSHDGDNVMDEAKSRPELLRLALPERSTFPPSDLNPTKSERVIPNSESEGDDDNEPKQPDDNKPKQPIIWQPVRARKSASGRPYHGTFPCHNSQFRVNSDLMRSRTVPGSKKLEAPTHVASRTPDLKEKVQSLAQPKKQLLEGLHTAPNLSESESESEDDNTTVYENSEESKRHRESTDFDSDSVGLVAGPSLGHGDREEGEEMELETDSLPFVNEIEPEEDPIVSGLQDKSGLKKHRLQSLSSVLTPSVSKSESESFQATPKLSGRRVQHDSQGEKIQSQLLAPDSEDDGDEIVYEEGSNRELGMQQWPPTADDEEEEEGNSGEHRMQRWPSTVDNDDDDDDDDEGPQSIVRRRSRKSVAPNIRPSLGIARIVPCKHSRPNPSTWESSWLSSSPSPSPPSTKRPKLTRSLSPSPKSEPSSRASATPSISNSISARPRCGRNLRSNMATSRDVARALSHQYNGDPYKQRFFCSAVHLLLTTLTPSELYGELLRLWHSLYYGPQYKSPASIIVGPATNPDPVWPVAALNWMCGIIGIYKLHRDPPVRTLSKEEIKIIEDFNVEDGGFAEFCAAMTINVAENMEQGELDPIMIKGRDEEVVVVSKPSPAETAARSSRRRGKRRF